MKVTASLIIVAAGSGKRIKSKTPKPFIQLCGKPILIHTLEKFRNISCIKEIILVLQKNDINWVIKKYGNVLAKLDVTKIVAGGKRRQDSVYNGLISSNINSDLIIIHDAVRPFITKEIILSVINSAKKYGAAVPAIPAKDTIKLIGQNNIVKNTLERQSLYPVRNAIKKGFGGKFRVGFTMQEIPNGVYQAQTPQVFKRAILLKAYRKSLKTGFLATDDSQIVEMAGFPVHMVQGGETNIKIANPAAISIAKTLL